VSIGTHLRAAGAKKSLLRAHLPPAAILTLAAQWRYEAVEFQGQAEGRAQDLP